MSRTDTTAGRRRKRKAPWARRIISTLILLALLAGLVFGAIKLFAWVGSFFQTENQKIKEQVVQQPVSYQGCQPGNVTATLTPSAIAMLEGDAMDVGVVLENTGVEPCTLTPGDLQMNIAVGGEVVWEPVQCWPDWAAMPLLLSPGQPWSTSFHWDGNVYVGCEPYVASEQSHPMDAAEGVYDLRYSLFGGEYVTSTQLVIQ